MKSVTRGNVAAGAMLADRGAMPEMTVDGAGGDAVPGGRAAARRVPLRELTCDRLLDAPLERSRDSAGGLRLTGEGSVLSEFIEAVLERALEAGLTTPR
jgi:hypothetical protein